LEVYTRVFHIQLEEILVQVLIVARRTVPDGDQ
jgi:hypothetical protein